MKLSKVYWLLLFGVSCTIHSSYAMQNILDYIQTYGRPVANKATAIMLFVPRKITKKVTSVFAERFPITTLLATAVGDYVAPDMMFNYLANEEYRNHSFQLAIRNNNPEALKKYLAAGYDVNAKNSFALRLAIHELNPLLVKLLLENKANANVIDDFGRTADQLVNLESPNVDKATKSKELLKLLEPYREAHKNAATKIAQEALETLSSPNPGYQQVADPATIIKSYL